MSGLRRLYTFAKSSREAREDFTTEALAIAIRHDPMPFVDVVRQAGLLAGLGMPDMVDAQTQATVPGVGRIDLVVRYSFGQEIVEHWFEIKVDAGESGDQLTRYSTYLASLPTDVQPVLATIAKRPIRSDGRLPFIGWQSIHEVSRRLGGSHWQELADWLEAMRVADDHGGPIEATEIASLAGAVSLYEKVCRVLIDVCDRGRPRFPTLSWPQSRAIATKVEHELSFRGRFILRIDAVDGRGFAALGLGTWVQDRAKLGLWVQTDPKYGPQRRRLLDTAEAGRLPVAWQRRVDTWLALTITLDPTPSITQDELVDWYVARLEELDAAGVLALLPSLGKGMFATTDEDPADEAGVL